MLPTQCMLHVSEYISVRCMPSEQESFYLHAHPIEQEIACCMPNEQEIACCMPKEQESACCMPNEQDIACCMPN